jgi:hypothetical protein
MDPHLLFAKDRATLVGMARAGAPAAGAQEHARVGGMPKLVLDPLPVLASAAQAVTRLLAPRSARNA